MQTETRYEICEGDEVIEIKWLDRSALNREKRRVSGMAATDPHKRIEIKRAKVQKQYFSHSEDGLRNGSFWRVSKYGIAQFVNGDFMGFINESAATHRGYVLTHGLDEFPATKAEKLIPACCK